MSIENPELRAEPVEPVEAETAKYNPEEIKDIEKRKATAQDIGKRKGEIKYDKKTPDGRETLSKEWMKKANLSEAQIKAIDDLVGITEGDDATVRDTKRKKWQSENGLGEGKDGKGEGDGIFGWKSLEKLDAQITDKKIQELSSIGDDSPYLSGAPDKINGLQIIDEQASEKAKKETDKSRLQTLKKAETDEGVRNGVIAAQEDGTGEDEFGGQKITFDKEKNGWKNAQGEFLDTDKGEFVSKEKQQEADKNRLQALKKAETDEGVRNGVIAAQEDGTGEDEFGGQKITFDKEKNGWKNAQGEFLDTKTGKFETKEARTERIKTEPVKINDLEIKDGEWTEEYSESTYEAGDGDGDTNPLKIQYFRDGDTVVKYDGKNLAYSVATRGENGDVGDFKESTYDGLPEGFKMKNAMVEAQNFANEMGNKRHNYSRSGLRTAYESRAVKNYKLSELDDLSTHFTEQFGLGPIVETDTGKLRGEINTFNEKIKPLLEKYPEMANLTVEEYAKMKTDPESFGTSGIMENSSIGQIIDPNKYGVKSEYTYTRADGGRMVRMPREGDSNIDTVQVLEKNGDYVSRRVWLQRARQDENIKYGVEYPLAGSPDLKMIKDRNGDISVYDTRKNEITDVYRGDKWMALRSHRENSESSPS